MNFRKYFRPKVPADRAAWAVGKSLLDADDCWRDVCSLREYKVAGSVATCEMAFARSAVIRHLYKSIRQDNISAVMTDAFDDLLKQSFAGDGGPELTDHYKQPNLTQIMLGRTAFYDQKAFPFFQLGMHFVLAVGVPDGRDATQIGLMFNAIYARGEKMLSQARLSADCERP
ncbi:hypothetical protein [uncultured Methylobacterium sp.]|uniref:hypothetical protein n=1 Tax=uncultured Methylobacterium sp. TaxID=157278 RepID=UPI0035CC9B9F